MCGAGGGPCGGKGERKGQVGWETTGARDETCIESDSLRGGGRGEWGRGRRGAGQRGQAREQRGTQSSTDSSGGKGKTSGGFTGRVARPRSAHTRRMGESQGEEVAHKTCHSQAARE